MISDLTRQEADVSIRAVHRIDDDLIGRRLVDLVNAAFATPAYLAAHPDVATTDGAGAHWIGWGDRDNWIAGTPLPKATAPHSLPEVFMQTEAAAANLGRAWVPAFLADTHPTLVCIPKVPIGAGRGIWALLHGDLRRTARVRAFVDFVTGWITLRKGLFVR